MPHSPPNMRVFFCSLTEQQRHPATGNMLDAMQMRTEVHCTTCGGHLVQSNCPPNCLIAAVSFCQETFTTV